MRSNEWLTLWMLGLGLVCCTHDNAEPEDGNGSGVGAEQSSGATLGAEDAPDEERFPLERIDQLPAVERGTPEGELIYDFGTGPTTYGSSIHIDEDGLYWAQASKLYRGSLDGSKEPQEIASCSTCFELDSDATHVYWLWGAFLSRRPKTLQEPEERIALQWDHTEGDVLADERYVYTAPAGCPAITRIDKQTLEQEFTYLSVPAGGVGGARLELGLDGAVYCASWHRIFRVAQWGEEGELLYDEAMSLEGIGLTDSHLVWLDKDLDRGKFSWVGRMPLSGGEAERIRLPIEGRAAEAVLDVKSNKLLFIKGSWVTQLDLATLRFTYVARDAVVMLRVWEGDMYWILRHAWDHRRGAQWGGIRKLPLDATPLFVFD